MKLQIITTGVRKMKKIILVASMLVASMSFAQRSANNELNINLGFTAGAANLGALYEMNVNESLSWGGYFFTQSEKDNTVEQVTALGALMKVHLVQKNDVNAYIAPGFGIAMMSDVGPANDDDKTVFGPSMRIGAQYHLNSTTKLGIERILFTNWFDDEAPSSVEYTSAVLGFEF